MSTTYLVDMDTGERLCLAIRPYGTDGKPTGETRAWLMRWRGTYGRRTGHRLALVDSDGPTSLLPIEGTDRLENDPGLTACPECEEIAVTHTAGPLPVCLACDWTGWGDNE